MTYASSSPFYPPLDTISQAWPRGPVKCVSGALLHFQSPFLEGCALVWRVHPLFKLAGSSFFCRLSPGDRHGTFSSRFSSFFFSSLTISATVVFSYPTGFYKHEHHRILPAASGIWVLTAPACEDLLCFRLFGLPYYLRISHEYTLCLVRSTPHLVLSNSSPIFHGFPSQLRTLFFFFIIH